LNKIFKKYAHAELGKDRKDKPPYVKEGAVKEQ
jgi:hypothetical protein